MVKICCLHNQFFISITSPGVYDRGSQSSQVAVTRNTIDFCGMGSRPHSNQVEFVCSGAASLIWGCDSDLSINYHRRY